MLNIMFKWQIFNPTNYCTLALLFYLLILSKYILLIILKNGTYDEDKDNLVKIIKDLEIIKDNKCIVERNGIIIKILIKDKNNIDKENDRADN